MKKKYLLFILIPFLFISCESVFLDMSDTSCSINKNIFEKDENIVLSLNGHFDSNDIGSCGINFVVYEIIDGERDKYHLTEFTIIDSNDFLDEEIDNGSYSAYIIKNSQITDFNKSLSFKINKPGTYQIEIFLSGYTKKQYYGGMNNFKYSFTVISFT